MLLRRVQTAALENETQDVPRPEAPPRPTAPAERHGLEAVRAEVQRKLAAQMDLGVPESPPEVERITPRVERGRMDALRAEAQRNSITKVERKPLLPNRGRFRITPSRLILLLVAVAAGGLAAFLATQQQQPPAPAVPHPLAPQVAEVQKTQILVAKQAIGMGERLSPASVEWADWPKGAVRPEYVPSGPDAMAEMTGAVARFEIFPGEPIRKDKLALPGQGYLSAVLDKGMRGVSVTITADSASGGFVVPDDHVDVVVTRTVNSSPVSQTILRNVRVLAINKRLGETGKTGAPANPDDPSANVFSDQAIATLQLDPVQAEVITAAAANGKLSLVLRSLSDFSAPTGGPSAANEAIRLTSPFWTSGGGSTLQTVH